MKSASVGHRGTPHAFVSMRHAACLFFLLKFVFTAGILFLSPTDYFHQSDGIIVYFPGYILSSFSPLKSKYWF